MKKVFDLKVLFRTDILLFSCANSCCQVHICISFVVFFISGFGIHDRSAKVAFTYWRSFQKQELFNQWKIFKVASAFDIIQIIQSIIETSTYETTNIVHSIVIDQMISLIQNVCFDIRQAFQGRRCIDDSVCVCRRWSCVNSIRILLCMVSCAVCSERIKLLNEWFSFVWYLFIDLDVVEYCRFLWS